MLPKEAHSRWDRPRVRVCDRRSVRRRTCSRSCTVFGCCSQPGFDYLPLVQPLYTLRESRPRSGFRSLDFGSACRLCDSQETVIRALNCIPCGSMLAYEVKLMRETIEKFAAGIVFTAASASSIEWLIEHIYQKPAEVNDIASMPRTRMSTGFSVGGIRKRDVCPRDEAEAPIVSARPVVMNSGWTQP